MGLRAKGLMLLLIALGAMWSVSMVLTLGEPDFKGAGYCLSCHPSEVREWSQSGHSKGFSNPGFQEIWKELGEPGQCLVCHTTGYNEDTGKYALKEVQCETCHGPGDTMEVDRSPELCGQCHSGPYPTYEEWLNSGPSHGEAECLSCHEQHTLELKYDSSTGTCGQCHESHVSELERSTHSAAGLECADCHMVTREADFFEGVQAETGHGFKPEREEYPCLSCHELSLEKHDALGEGASACLSCHGDIHELELGLINGSVVPLEDPVPLCAQCHNERFTAWKRGTHGAYDDPKAECTECHNPHSPVVAGVETLNPIPIREPATTPSWLWKAALVVVFEVVFLGVLVRWRGS